MMSFAVLFTSFRFHIFSGMSRFGLKKYENVLETKGSCKVTGLMFS